MAGRLPKCLLLQLQTARGGEIPAPSVPPQWWDRDLKCWRRGQDTNSSLFWTVAHFFNSPSPGPTAGARNVVCAPKCRAKVWSLLNGYQLNLQDEGRRRSKVNSVSPKNCMKTKVVLPRPMRLRRRMVSQAPLATGSKRDHGSLNRHDRVARSPSPHPAEDSHSKMDASRSLLSWADPHWLRDS